MLLQHSRDTSKDAESELAVPFINDQAKSEEGEEEISAYRFTYLFRAGIVTTLLLGLALGIVFYLRTSKSSDNYENQCYVAPSCQNVNIKQVSDPSTGFTNNTGFNSDSDGACCNICYPGMPQTVCFDTVTSTDLYSHLWGMDGPTTTAAVNCSDKTGDQDYDFLLLDQIYLPQWCSALSAGHDPTLSHLQGSQCTAAVTSGANLLNIHGLWPNYFHGYPQCCNAAADNNAAPQPLDPLTVQSTWTVYPQLQQYWFDPTTSTVEDQVICSTCYLMNHEWEKHGTCFSPLEPETYFTTGLDLYDKLSGYTAQVTGLSESVVATADIQAFYPHSVNVVCDPQASPPAGVDATAGVFLELQTCYTLTVTHISLEEVLNYDTATLGHHVVLFARGTKRVLSSLPAMKEKLRSAASGSLSLRSEFEEMDLGEYDWIDCPAASAGHFTTPCPENTYVGSF